MTTFEILCVDSKGFSVIVESDGLLHRLKGNGKLWKKPCIKSNEIVDNDLKITCRISKLETNPDTVNSAFLVSISGDSEQLEQFRIQIVKYLKEEKFDSIYIVLDEISQDFGAKLYPHINSIENLLRKFLILYSSTKLGPKWWNMMADSDIERKVNQRRNNETVFSQLISINGKNEPLADNRAYLIDFDDLGNMIYEKSAGNLTVNDIYKQVESCSNESDFLNFKNNLQKNIKKYFSDFEQAKFQERWEYLKSIRNKVAHNSLIVKDEFERAIQYLTDLKIFLKEQNDKIGSTKVDPEEIESIQESFVKSSLAYKLIDESELAKELHKYYDWTKRNRRPFAGKKNFVVNILGVKGFDFSNSYLIIDQLVEKGYLSTYEWTDPDGIYPAQEAFKLLKPLTELYESE